MSCACFMVESNNGSDRIAYIIIQLTADFHLKYNYCIV
jgi:hypothetical protein